MLAALLFFTTSTFACPSTTCGTSGLENAERIPITLFDQGGNDAFWITRFPQHGTLYLDTVALNSSWNATIKGDGLNHLWYQPSKNYFNRAGSNEYANIHGGGWNGCPQTSAPGCPDGFGFRSRGVNHYNYTIQVENVFTPLIGINSHQEYFYAHPNTNTLLEYYNYNGNLQRRIPFFSITDMDQDIYTAHLFVRIQNGVVGLKDTLGIPVVCSNGESVTKGCETLSFTAVPSMMNQLLGKLFVRVSSFDQKVQLTARVSKPFVDDPLTKEYTSVISILEMSVTSNPLGMLEMFPMIMGSIVGGTIGIVLLAGCVGSLVKKRREARLRSRKTSRVNPKA